MYFKLLETFVLHVLFSRDEYNVRSKNFNPVKVVIMLLLVGNVFFSAYLYGKLAESYTVIETFCPILAREIDKGLTKEQLFQKLKQKTDKFCHY